MDKRQLYDEINSILMTWNPIGVSGSALSDEYLRYIPNIVRLGTDSEQLSLYLGGLISDLGMEYDPDSQEQRDEVVKVAHRVENVLRRYEQH